MALVKCPECGKEVSEDVGFCENCGTKYNKACLGQNGECIDPAHSEQSMPEDFETGTDTCFELNESEDMAKSI